MLAALISSSLAVATGSPRKPDGEESGTAGEKGTQILWAKARDFYECLEVCAIFLLLLRPQLAFLQASRR